MAISTYKSFLMHKKSSTWEKLVDIKSFPDLGGAPELLETTTLSDNMTTNILGIQSLDALEFECNYTKEDYTKLKAMEGTNMDFAVWLGGTEASGTVTPTGSDGKFEFKGQLSVFVNGGGVNEVVNMTVSIAASTPITLGADA
ncbi:MAG: hypothetical protein IKW20_05935 [Bacteroidales bacterium]|nr:hypothetical protein [Bacteroidales bacterium]